MRFLTDDLPEAERLERCAEVVRDTLGHFDFEPVAGEPFRAEVLAFDLPGIGLATCFLSRSRSCLRAAHCRGDACDRILLLRPVNGAMTVAQDGRELRVAAGDGVLVSLSRPLVCDFADAGRVDCLRLSRRALGYLLPDVDAALMRPVSSDLAALQLLVYYGGALLRGMLPLPSPEHARLAVGHMQDLVGLMFRAEARAAHGGRAARLAAIKADVEDRIGRQGVSAGEIAARHGVSPRYVQKLFEAEGTTFSAYVLDRRLERARRLLDRADGRPISAIAYDVGFGDLSYFNRTFRRRFGVAPSRLRARP
ncbi:helix-turn-helix domain-containing protein [Zavarzinia compransoris]|uniref:helix-turn-helix domain-containing protein n=1 Tax=Zavarzinia marina TaxID=2911065 RepID=UPI001F2C4FA4|nr:helix-turn-helix domain-containing protein [Zavarzinia marina]MCF4166584.1 helix-turn-helix domain-containing protein [Zavarzinia marina]